MLRGLFVAGMCGLDFSRRLVLCLVMRTNVWRAVEVVVPAALVPQADEIIGLLGTMPENAGARLAHGSPETENRWILYFDTTEPTDSLLARIRELAAVFGLAGDCVSAQPDVLREDWGAGWREFFKPVLVTDRITVVPSWTETKSPDEGDAIVVRIEPGMAFGTGTHATTQLCMKLCQKHLRRGDRVLDAGTGSAILCIAAVKLGSGFAIGFDLDPDIIENAALNLRLNGVTSSQAQIFVGTPDAMHPRQFDFIFCNMLLHEFRPLLPLLHTLCAENSLVLLSGLLRDEEAEVRGLVRDARFDVVDSDTVDEWSGLVLRPA